MKKRSKPKFRINFRILLGVIALVLSVIAVYYFATNASTTTQSVVFKSGANGNPWYRIPAVVRGEGYVFAFAEKRNIERDENKPDDGDFDIVMRRSEDNGNTWDSITLPNGSNEVSVANDGRNRVSNPVPFWTYGSNPYNKDKVEPILILVSTVKKYTDYTNRAGSVDGFYVQKSYGTYNGKTEQWGINWTPISSATKKGRMLNPQNGYLNTGNALSGPGHGVDIRGGGKVGRLAFPMSFTSSGVFTTATVFTDDKGEHWSIGATRAHTGNPGLDLIEGSIAEIPDRTISGDNGKWSGSLLVCYRNKQGKDNTNKGTVCVKQYSDVAGVVFKGSFEYSDLVKKPMQSSIIGLYGDEGEEHILMSAPSHSEDRKGMAIFHSSDEGSTWHKRFFQVVDANRFSGYSDLTQINSYLVGIIYEDLFKEQQISFQKIKMTDVVLPK